MKVRLTRVQVVEFDDGELAAGETEEQFLAAEIKNAEEMPEHVFDLAQTTITGEIVK